MAAVVTEPCVGCKYTDCLVVCPCECFYGDEQQLYIDPDDCIDCGACVPECPVEAIYLDDAVPERWEKWLDINRERAAVLPVVNTRQEPLPTARERVKALGIDP